MGQAIRQALEFFKEEDGVKIGDKIGMNNVTNVYQNGVWEVVEINGDMAEVSNDNTLWASWSTLTVSSVTPFEYAVSQVMKVVGDQK